MTHPQETPQSRATRLSASAVDALLRDTTPWLSCEECFERMDAYAEGVVRGLPPEEAMAKHMRGCAACEEEAQSLIELLRADR
jgi:hypothetical protein